MSRSPTWWWPAVQAVGICAWHPQPRDIGLLIEVADTTLADDRTTKKRVYARARVGVYWIVNLVDFAIEVYAQPRAGRRPTYRQERSYRAPEAVPLVLGDHDLGAIPVSELLPEQEA